MGTPGYLYGDSTPSPLTTDFIAFLRDTFGFAVEVLACDARIAGAAERVAGLAETTEREIECADAVAAEVERALDRASVGHVDSFAARYAMRVRQDAKDLLRSEGDAARAAVAAEKARALQASGNDREACVKAFERLVLRHALPDAVWVTRVTLGTGGRYDAQLHAHTPYGLEWVVALEVPAEHPLADVLRVDRVVERLEIEAPEEGGWLHKEVRIRPQRFDRLHLVDLTIDPAETVIKLRASADGTGAGFDVSFRREAPHVRLVRILEGGEGPDAPHNVAGDDVGRLRSLLDALVAMARELEGHKKAMRSAAVDDRALQQLDAPRLLAERILANIAPTVHEIAKRSLSPGELVLKRLLGDNHREEIFLSKQELKDQLEGLPESHRQPFDLLELWEPSGSAPHPAGAPPATPAAPSPPPAAPKMSAAPVAPPEDAPERPGLTSESGEPFPLVASPPPDRPQPSPPQPAVVGAGTAIRPPRQ